MSTEDYSLLSDYLIPTTRVGGRVNPLSSLLNEVVNPPVLNQPDPSLLTGPKRQENFANWFKQSKAVNERGVPLTLYHGTTHDFKEFKPEIGSKDGFMGSSIYLSDSPDDASINYGAQGEDLLSRIARRVEDLVFQGPAVQDENARADFEKLAKKELMGSAERVIPVNASLQNPIYLSKNPEASKQYIDFNKMFDVEEAPKEEDFEDYNEYEAELDEWYMTSNDQMLQEVQDTLRSAFYESDDEANYKYADFNEKVISPLLTEIMDGGGSITPEQIDYIIRNNSAEADHFESGETIKNFFQKLGYDGIVMDAETYFPRMKYTEGTKHYILFDPTKVKSLFNRGTYDPSNPDITAKRQPRKSLLEV